MRMFLCAAFVVGGLAACGGGDSAGRASDKDVLSSEAVTWDFLEGLWEDSPQVSEALHEIAQDLSLDLPDEVASDLALEAPENEDAVSEPGTEETDLQETTLGECPDILMCMFKLHCSDDACTKQCLALGSGEAQGQFGALGVCWTMQCSQYDDATETSQWLSCIYGKCKEKAEVCVSVGDKGCGWVTGCVLKCDPKATMCFVDCLWQGTYDAQAAFLALAACREKNCPDGSAQCMADHCSIEAQNCL